MQKLIILRDINRAFEPEITSPVGLFDKVKGALSYKIYNGDEIEDDAGVPLPGVLGISGDSQYIELLAVDGKSLQKGGFQPASVNGTTYYLRFVEVYT